MSNPETQNLQSIYVARTVPDQKRFDSFLKGVSRTVGRTIDIRKATNTHLTILESRGVKEMQRERGYGSAEVTEFRAGLQHHLDKGGHRKPIKVTINPDQSLAWKCRRLVVDIIPSEQLKDQRGRAEEYLLGQFGILPPLRPFEPHITIGTSNTRQLPVEWAEDPSTMIPGYCIVPNLVTLNGLEVYFNRIHPVPMPERNLPTIDSSIADFAATV